MLIICITPTIGSTSVAYIFVAFAIAIEKITAKVKTAISIQSEYIAHRNFTFKMAFLAK